MEEVILVDTDDNEIGIMEKIEAHEKALLHRAFSVFIFNSKGEMLLQQRAKSKYHSGGLWTNACCSHPRKNETTLAAAERRLNEEMGITVQLKHIFSFTYKTNFDNGLTEHEFDHVFVGYYDGRPNINTNEVENYAYNTINLLEENIKINSSLYTTWFLIAFPKVVKWWKLQQA
jgi:isopentenyl-diphosphate delta-isomerase